MRIDWIEQGKLGAGGVMNGRDELETLRAEGIRAILTLTEAPLITQRDITAERLARLDIVTLHFPIYDQHPPKPDTIGEAVAFIDTMINVGRPVYMHCRAGIGRTGTVLHAYYLLHGLNLEDAKAKVKAVKPTSQFFLLSPKQQAFLEGLAASLAP